MKALMTSLTVMMTKEEEEGGVMTTKYGDDGGLNQRNKGKNSSATNVRKRVIPKICGIRR
jgi:hypothetical protein